MSDTSNLLQWLGHTVVDRGGRPLGPVGGIYLDARSDLAKWVLVRGERGRLVPLRGAIVQGDRIRVAFDAASVDAAPDLKADDDLDPDEETRLLHHYDVPVGDEGIDLPLPRPPARGATGLAPAPAASGAPNPAPAPVERPLTPPPVSPGSERPAPPPAVPPAPLPSPTAPDAPALHASPPTPEAPGPRTSPPAPEAPAPLPSPTAPVAPAPTAPLAAPTAPEAQTPTLAADAPKRRRARRSVRSLVRGAVRRNPVGLALATAGTGVLVGLLREPAQHALQRGLKRVADARAGHDGPVPPPDAPAPSE